MSPQPGGEAPGVIFDLDGTLADTLDDITSAVNVAIATRGRSPLSAAEVRQYVGDGVVFLMSRASGSTDEAIVAEQVRLFRGYYHKHLLDRTRLYPGIGEVLDRLHGAGCPLAVLSNKPHDSVGEICEELLGKWPFVAYWGARDGVPVKPEPATALGLADRMEREPASVFFVGDSEPDVEAANAAGMKAIGVTWGFRDRDTLVGAGAKVVVRTPAGIVDAVLGLA